MRAIEPEQYQAIARVGNVRGARLKAAAAALDLREVGAFLDACAADPGPTGARDACLLSLLAGAGLRRAEAGIRRRFSPHDLRHFFASEAVAEGGDLKAVSDLLGHASVSTTQIYVHGGERAKRQAAARVRQPYRLGGVRRRTRPRRSLK